MLVLCFNPSQSRKTTALSWFQKSSSGSRTTKRFCRAPPISEMACRNDQIVAFDDAPWRIKLGAVWDCATTGTPRACCEPRGSLLMEPPCVACACVARRVDRHVTGEQVGLRTARWHAASGDVGERESHGRRGLLRSGQVAGSRGWRWRSDPSRAARWHLRNWVAVCGHCGWPSVRAESGRRGEVKGGTEWRMAMAFRCVRLVRPLESAWTRLVRFPGARALGSSSARRLGGLAGPAISPAQRQRPREQRGRPNARNGETGICWPENCGA